MLQDIKQEFQRHHKLAELALAELDDSSFAERLRPHVNPIALIVKHVAGNLQSRWTGFLSSDGEKPDRDRDSEFEMADADTRETIMAAWNRGWSALWETLDAMNDSDLDRLVTIRGEPHTARQAVLRGLTHTAYHVGQILYLVRTLRPDSRWLTIPPGTSRTYMTKYLIAPGASQ